MKKIVFLIVLTLLGSVCVAQRNGGSRPSSPARSSVSSSRPSSNRGGYTPSSRSRTTTYSTPRTSNRNVVVNSRSETRSHHGTTNPTRTVRNTPRSQNNGSYSRPNHQSVVQPPKSHAPHHVNHPHHTPRGMHPAPPMHHPIHHHRPIHMHHHVCYNWMVHDMYWYGYWRYVRTYPFNDVVVYVNSNYPSTTVIAVVSDENYVYTIYRDEISNTTYFTITDQTDNVLVKTQVNRKYCRIMTDDHGIWLLRKNDRNPMYFIYQDGNLYQYEED